MNNLNSILLEGEVRDMPQSKKGILWFSMVSTRYQENSEQEEIEKVETHITVGVEGKKLAENVINLAKEGRGLRIVGRLEEYGIRLVVMAEHVEFRPV